MAALESTDQSQKVEPMSESVEKSKKESSLQKQNMMNTPYFRLGLLTVMCLQNTIVVLLGSYTRANKTKEELYAVNHVILASELGKFVLSLLLENYETNNLLGNLKIHVIDNPVDCLKISIPSLLYLLQNTLLYVALSNLSAPMFQVTYQTKLLTTALLSKLLLNRTYSLKQWTCLMTLGIGVAIVVIGGEDKGKSDTESTKEVVARNFTLGLTSVSIACMSSAMAGVYFEKVLKKPIQAGSKAPATMWMRNIQMAFFSAVIAYFQFKNLTGEDGKKELFHGFTNSVWLLVFVQSCGGLLVAAVIKYADNVLKGMSTGMSVILSTACSSILFKTALTFQFGFGALIILVSVYLFSNDMPKCSKVKIEEPFEEGVSLVSSKV